MAKLKRSVNWLDSFDFGEFDEPTSKKQSSPKEVKNEKTDNSFNVPSSFPVKRKSNCSLSALINLCLPQKPSDLAVSRQKQQEISRWFQEKVKLGRPSLLVISGPSGCGKTEALKVIAKENKFDIVEWITPMDQAMDENNRIMRQGERFEDFLIRATRYSSVLSDNSRRLLLVKDIPNSYVEGKDDFLALLGKYCQYGREPLVFVNTETGNSKLMTSLFSQSNRDRYGIDLININATTPTALKNMMKRVSSILNAKASHMLYVTQEKIDEVLSNNIGDARSALLNLIFVSLKVTQKLHSECTVREETLGLLHGVGRVINPKRNCQGKHWKFVHNPDDLAATFESSASTLIKFIHENYLNTMGFNMDGANLAIDSISLADVMNTEWRDSNIHKLALSHCVRGVMIANDKPVSQWNPVRKPSNSEYDVQRNFDVAEMKWYERYIQPKSKKATDPAELSESIIEEITECVSKNSSIIICSVRTPSSPKGLVLLIEVEKIFGKHRKDRVENAEHIMGLYLTKYHDDLVIVISTSAFDTVDWEPVRGGLYEYNHVELTFPSKEERMRLLHLQIEAIESNGALIQFDTDDLCEQLAIITEGMPVSVFYQVGLKWKSYAAVLQPLKPIEKDELSKICKYEVQIFQVSYQNSK